MSQQRRKIAIVEVSRPMDGSSGHLAAAYERKIRTYTPLLAALQAYPDDGWQVELFPWVVGVRGLLDSAAIQCCLEFLELPRKCWRRIIEDTAKESVKAFYALHRVRCKALQLAPRPCRMRTAQNKAGVLKTNLGTFDADDPGRACNRKRRRRSDEDIDDTRKRWRQMEKMTRKKG